MVSFMYIHHSRKKYFQKGTFCEILRLFLISAFGCPRWCPCVGSILCVNEISSLIGLLGQL